MFERVWIKSKELFEGVIKSDQFPESIAVRDCTLREGEQAADIVFSVEDKLQIAERLESIGIRRIQVGMPGRSEIDKNVFERLKGSKISREAFILAYGLKWKEEIDQAISVGASSVDIVMPCSEYRLKEIMNLSQEEMLRISQEAIIYGKNNGLNVSFVPSDTTRASLKFLQEIGQMAAQSGADFLFVADTVGVATPETMRLIVRSLRDLGVKLGVHAHNDLGLGLANAIAAVQEGAVVVDVCINGLGERAGGVALDEFVVVVQELFCQPLGIKTESLYALSKFVESLTGFSIPPTKPLVGSQAFAHKLDTHIQGVSKYMPAYQGINPQVVGRKIDVILGNLSGPFAIRKKAQDLQISLEEENIDKIVQIVRNSASSLKRALTDAEFIDIASGFMKPQKG